MPKNKFQNCFNFKCFGFEIDLAFELLILNFFYYYNYIITANKTNDNLWKNIAAGAKELFFPKQCFFCKKYGYLLCDDCESLLDVCPAHRPDRDRKYLTDIYSACSFENKFVKKMIYSFKYEPLWRDLGAPLSELVVNHFSLSEQNFDRDDSVIIPVPLAKKRLRWRGFNQAEIIARNLGRQWQIPVAPDCLARTRDTDPQAELSQARRQKNINGAFACADNALFENKSVCLVDDVVTTGATMEECARVLLAGKARQVTGVSIARTERP